MQYCEEHVACSLIKRPVQIHLVRDAYSILLALYQCPALKVYNNMYCSLAYSCMIIHFQFLLRYNRTACAVEAF